MVKDSRRIAAILAADVVDYSRLTASDEAGALAALKIRRALFDSLVAEFGGREFGSVGDSLMAEFPSAVNAVLCAFQIQLVTEKENASLTVSRRMRLRIGVNLGDVIEEGGSVFGDTVNVAARLQSLAKPGGVVIAGAVYDQVRGKIPARFVAAGIREVKNIREPVRTFEAHPGPAPGIRGWIATHLGNVASRRVRRVFYAVAALSVAVALGLFWRELSVSDSGRRLGALLRPQVGESASYSIAVLPFVNMSGDSGNDYLGEGLSEELTNRLTKFPALRVAARTSAFAFKGKNLDVGEIASRLGVGYVLQGSVKRQADRIRVTASLVNGASGSNRWSNSYELPASDFFAIESDMVTQVITALELVLDQRAGTSRSEPNNDNSGLAYDYYLQGLAHLRQPISAKSLETAERLFRRALAEQPDLARAQAGLCETRVDRYDLEGIPAHVAAAEEACANAAALDSAAHEVHMAVGRLRLVTGDAARAESEYRRALALVPQSSDVLIGLAESLAAGGKTDEAESNYKHAIAAQSSYAAAHIAYGNFLLSQGRASDAIPAYERAAILAPDNPNALNNLGGAHLYMGNFQKAADAFTRSLALEPRRGSYSNTGTVEYYLGHFREAADMFRKAIEFAPADHRLWGNLADALRFDSRADEAEQAYRRALELVDGELAVNPQHAFNQALAAYYLTRIRDEKRARRCIEAALAEGADDANVNYYVALAELGLGDASKALTHVRRARDLGYPENLIRAAPELGDIRARL